MWVVLGLLSSLFLGTYDVLKKQSVQENAVLPVLFFAVSTMATLFIPLILLSLFFPTWAVQYIWYVEPVDAEIHAYFALKALIVGTSWVLGYFALKHLPITIAMPVRASSPLWTFIGALLIFHEQLNAWQYLGIGITFLSYYFFSLIGKTEGIQFSRNRWIWFIVLATLIGAGSGLYDKFLMLHFPRWTMQAYYSCYLLVYLFPVYLLSRRIPSLNRHPFQWRWSIIFIGIFLQIADFLYFYALSYGDSLIAVLTILRRFSVVIAFATGALLFKEKNIKKKAFVLIGILAGIICIVIGSTA